MKMKKYTANTMVEAMKKVRTDFGDDAVILSSTVVKTKGFLGLFQKKMVEVVAGFDEPTVKHVPSAVHHVTEHVSEKTASLPDMDLNKEMKEMKRLLKQMQQSSRLDHYPDDLKPLLAHLESQELDRSLIAQIGNEIFARMKTEKRDFSIIEQIEMTEAILREEFGKLSFGGTTFTKKYVNVLGPTGVGKTTTIAKIAARALLERKKKIGFITTDTYRIAAIEQLRTYANLLQAPVEVAYNANDFQSAIEKLEDRDLLFIDTAGRNYKEEKFVRDLQSLVDFSLEMELYLVLSVTSKEEDMKAIINQFNTLPIQRFIFTKVDETGSIGPIFNLMKEYQMGVAYYTDGQEVPEDLVEATLDSLISLLMEGVPHA
ncbi:flagellar biosynthesis protein FlhF [Sporosarcina luteola]|nr:flagellar biosynthesis protein FlhF [Sporosarcina luteola]